MSIKSRVLGLVRGMNAVAGRGDLPRRDARLDAESGRAPASAPAVDASPAAVGHLGGYGALITAVHDELARFVAGQVSLHLAIAERDRFLLTAIGVRCGSSNAAGELLRQFMHEFKPEQVKRYLAREVIAALPNAAAIDLSQFAGLYDADARDAKAQADRDSSDADEYRELLAALAPPPVATPSSAFVVSVQGRWSEVDAARPPTASRPAAPAAVSATPLASERCEFDVEDADGRRRVVLPAVVAGRRYVVGTGEGCDIRVNGTYVSRRHAEIWTESGQWWVADAGSTNGLRVASPARPQAESTGPAPADGRPGGIDPPLRLDGGARIVLSARAEGPARDYPWLALRSPFVSVAPTTAPGVRMTPIATATALGAGPAAAASGMSPAGSGSGSAARSGSGSAAGTPRTALTAIFDSRPRAAEPL
ncbi:MAG: FHA domain-containing protein, partial [Rubrivivax sp.]